MTDVKDILGLSREGGDGGEAKKEKQKELKTRPKGMSRETFNLLHGSHHIQQGDMMRKIAQQEEQKSATYTKVCSRHCLSRCARVHIAHSCLNRERSCDCTCGMRANYVIT